MIKVLALMVIIGGTTAVWATVENSPKPTPPLAPVRHAQRLESRNRARRPLPSGLNSGGITGNNGGSPMFTSGGSTGSVLIDPKQVPRGSGISGHSNLAHQTLTDNDQNRLVSVSEAQSKPVRSKPKPAIREEEIDPKILPQPYQYSYEAEDPNGARIDRAERTDENGVIIGYYTIRDPNGMIRIVKYVADDQGFHVDIQSNEPGMIPSNPANVKIKTITDNHHY